MTNGPTVRRLPENERDASLGFDTDESLVEAPVQIGEEDWRDGATDDGEQDSEQ